MLATGHLHHAPLESMFVLTFPKTTPVCSISRKRQAPAHQCCRLSSGSLPADGDRSECWYSFSALLPVAVTALEDTKFGEHTSTPRPEGDKPGGGRDIDTKPSNDTTNYKVCRHFSNSQFLPHRTIIRHTHTYGEIAYRL